MDAGAAGAPPRDEFPFVAHLLKAAEALEEAPGSCAASDGGGGGAQGMQPQDSSATTTLVFGQGAGAAPLAAPTGDGFGAHFGPSSADSVTSQHRPSTATAHNSVPFATAWRPFASAHLTCDEVAHLFPEVPPGAPGIQVPLVFEVDRRATPAPVEAHLLLRQQHAAYEVVLPRLPSSSSSALWRAFDASQVAWARDARGHLVMCVDHVDGSVLHHATSDRRHGLQQPPHPPPPQRSTALRTVAVSLTSSPTHQGAAASPAVSRPIAAGPRAIERLMLAAAGSLPQGLGATSALQGDAREAPPRLPPASAPAPTPAAAADSRDAPLSSGGSVAAPLSEQAVPAGIAWEGASDAPSAAAPLARVAPGVAHELHVLHQLLQSVGAQAEIQVHPPSAAPSSGPPSSSHAAALTAAPPQQQLEAAPSVGSGWDLQRLRLGSTSTGAHQPRTPSQAGGPSGAQPAARLGSLSPRLSRDIASMTLLAPGVAPAAADPHHPGPAPPLQHHSKRPGPHHHAAWAQGDPTTTAADRDAGRSLEEGEPPAKRQSMGSRSTAWFSSTPASPSVHQQGLSLAAHLLPAARPAPGSAGSGGAGELTRAQQQRPAAHSLWSPDADAGRAAAPRVGTSVAALLAGGRSSLLLAERSASAPGWLQVPTAPITPGQQWPPLSPAAAGPLDHLLPPGAGTAVALAPQPHHLQRHLHQQQQQQQQHLTPLFTLPPPPAGACAAGPAGVPTVLLLQPLAFNVNPMSEAPGAHPPAPPVQRQVLTAPLSAPALAHPPAFTHLPHDGPQVPAARPPRKLPSTTGGRRSSSGGAGAGAVDGQLVLPSANRRIVGRNFYLGRSFMVGMFGSGFQCPLQCTMQLELDGELEPKRYQVEFVAGSTSWYPRGLPLSLLRGLEMCGARWMAAPPSGERTLVMVFKHAAPEAAPEAAHGSFAC